MEFPSQPWGGALTSIQLAGDALYLAGAQTWPPPTRGVAAWACTSAGTEAEPLQDALSLHEAQTWPPPMRRVAAWACASAGTEAEPLTSPCLHEQCWQATEASVTASSLYSISYVYM